MKMLALTCIKEDLKAVSGIMEKAEIDVFSVSEIVGHKTTFQDYLPDNWFGKNDDATEALFFFSFTDNEKAVNAIELVKTFNKENKVNYPIRAFVLPVELSSY